MQNFDPKLYDNQSVQRRTPANEAEPVNKRREEVGQQEHNRKKRFTLDDNKEAAEETAEEELAKTPKAVQGAVSPFSLVRESRKAPIPGEALAGVAEQSTKKEVPPEKNAPVAAFAPVLEASVQSPTITNAPTVPAVQKVALEEMVKQVIQAVTQVKNEGKAEMTITLSHPPIFEGVQIKLTSFETARGEFNISFTGLSNEAKQLIDLPAARESLLNALAEKGYIVHIFIATTQREEVITSKSLTPEKEKRDQEDSQEGRKKKR